METQRSHSFVNIWMSVFIIAGICGVILVSGAFAIYVYDMSFVIATDPVYSDLGYMRLPVLVLTETCITLFMLACTLAIPYVFLIMRGKVYTSASIRYMRIMGACFFLMLLPLLGLTIYLESKIGQTITNLYIYLAMGIATTVGCIFYLFSSLIQQGRHYKEENDLTI